MAKLYELVGEYRDLYELNLDDETLKDTLDSIDWADRLSEKVEGYAQVIETALAEAKMFEEAEKKFKAKKRLLRKKPPGCKGMSSMP